MGILWTVFPRWSERECHSLPWNRRASPYVGRGQKCAKECASINAAEFIDQRCSCLRTPYRCSLLHSRSRRCNSECAERVSICPDPGRRSWLYRWCHRNVHNRPDIGILQHCRLNGWRIANRLVLRSWQRSSRLQGSKSSKFEPLLALKYSYYQIERRTTVPVRAVLLVTVCSAAIGLINIGSTTAFNDVVSLVLEGFYASYLVCCGLVLYRRLRRQISQAGPDGKASTLYAWGPWRLPIWFGIFNNVIAIAYLLVMMTFGFFPAAIPVTAASMNYSVLVLGGVATFSLVYYYAWARRSYNGPVVEVKLREI